MNTRPKFDQDLNVAADSIWNIVHCLKEKIPTEMVTLGLLRAVNFVLLDIDDFDQWELLKGEIVDLRDEFEYEVEPYLSKLIDQDLEADKYNKRHG